MPSSISGSSAAPDPDPDPLEPPPHGGSPDYRHDEQLPSRHTEGDHANFEIERQYLSREKPRRKI